MDLTKRQQEIFDFIKRYSAKYGYPPTVRDIGKAVGLASSSTVHAHLANLERIARQPGYARPFPVLVAASRKGFLGKLLAGADGRPRSFARSDDATIALTALAVAAGAWCVRVHAVPGNVDAVRVATRWRHEIIAGAG